MISVDCWHSLGTLSQGHFGESDIVYVAGYYYAVSTASYEGQGSTEMRIASTPEGIVGATPFQVATGVYPTLAYDPVTWYWHLYVEDFAGSFMKHYVSTLTPTNSTSFALQPRDALDFGSVVDLQIRKHPTNGKWYAVGISDGDGWLTILSADGPNGMVAPGDYHGFWPTVCGLDSFDPGADIFAVGAGQYPDWASVARPDPNLAFAPDGRVYVLFTGYADEARTYARVGYVEVDLATGYAIGPAVELPDPHPSWANGENLSDLNLVSAPGQPSRIFGFGQTRLGCLDVLTASASIMPPVNQ